MDILNKGIIFLLMMIALSSFVSSNYCYQPGANISTTCAPYDNGTYNPEGATGIDPNYVFTSPEHTTDNDDNTYG